MKYFIVGVTVLLIFSMTGCGGVSHKSPEKVTEELINAYANGKEKKVKDCYNEKKDTEDSLQFEITATIKYFQAHNTKKVNIQECDIISENDKYTYVYITYNMVLEDDQEYPCIGTYMIGKKDFFVPNLFAKISKKRVITKKWRFFYRSMRKKDVIA